MKPDELLAILHTAAALKDTTRHCYTAQGRHESVAEHSWRVTLMAYFLRSQFPELDMDKVTAMCLIHDLGECFTGDIPTFEKAQADTEREDDLLAQWVAALPQPKSRVRVICNTLLFAMSTENFLLAFGRIVPVWCLGAALGWIFIKRSKKSV